MDPDACLAELLEFAKSEEGGEDIDIERIKELLQGLDGWLMKGGFPPRRWRQGRAGINCQDGSH